MPCGKENKSPAILFFFYLFLLWPAIFLSNFASRLFFFFFCRRLSYFGSRGFIFSPFSPPFLPTIKKKIKFGKNRDRK